MSNPQVSHSALPDRRLGMPRAEAAPRRLPPRLAAALRTAHAGELSATGDQRRPAFRLTRCLIGGARLAGFSATTLARCLDVSVESIRTRGGSDGWISGEVFTELAGLEPGSVERWEAEELLTDHTVDEGGRACYLASELIRAVAATPRPR